MMGNSNLYVSENREEAYSSSTQQVRFTLRCNCKKITAVPRKEKLYWMKFPKIGKNPSKKFELASTWAFEQNKGSSRGSTIRKKRGRVPLTLDAHDRGTNPEATTVNREGTAD